MRVLVRDALSRPLVALLRQRLQCLARRVVLLLLNRQVVVLTLLRLQFLLQRIVGLLPLGQLALPLQGFALVVPKHVPESAKALLQLRLLRSVSMSTRNSALTVRVR